MDRRANLDSLVFQGPQEQMEKKDAWVYLVFVVRRVSLAFPV